MANILVISGEQSTCDALRTCLKQEGHLVAVCANSASAPRLFATLSPDLICLDAADAPSAGDLWPWLRADDGRSSIPVLFVLPPAGRWTAGAAPPQFRPDRDDWIARPLDVGALQQKTARLLSVSPSAACRSRTLRLPPFTLDCDTRDLWAGDKKAALTPTEYRLMAYLIERPGTVVGSDELLETVWGFHPGTATPSVVRVHVSNLRRKMAALGYARLLEALPHRGYRLLEEKRS